MSIPSTFERRWPTVILAPITIANHVVTVSSTKGLHTKQEIILSNGSLPQLTLEIKRVISDTQIAVGEKDKAINKLENPVAYSGGILTSIEQKRNEFGAEIVWRAVYEEEPAVALRTVLVDWVGSYYSLANPLPVSVSTDLTVSTEAPRTPGLTIVTSPIVSDDQFTIVLPSGVKRFTLKPRRGTQASFDIALVPYALNSDYYSVLPGDEFLSGSINLAAPKTFYLRTKKTSVEIECWYWST